MNWGPLESVRDIRECSKALGIVESVRERYRRLRDSQELLRSVKQC